jgi:hypothetical protein
MAKQNSKQQQIRTKGLRKKKGGALVTNITNGKVPIECIDGVTRYVKFTMRAVAAMELAYPERDSEGNFTGNPATPIGVILSWAKPERGMAWSLLENFLWAGFLHEYPYLTKEEMSEWLDLTRIVYYDAQVSKAIRIALGTYEAEAAKEEEDTKNGQLIGET